MISKKILNIVLVGLFLLTIGFIAYNEVKKQGQVPDFLLGIPHMDTIRVERRIQGKIMPAEEIQVKSKINGIVEKVSISGFASKSLSLIEANPAIEEPSNNNPSFTMSSTSPYC